VTSETAAPEVATSDRQQLPALHHHDTHLTQLINRYGPNDPMLHAKAPHGDDYMVIPAVTPSTRNKTVISLFFLFGACGSVVA
jgi:hypothetical protein